MADILSSEALDELRSVLAEGELSTDPEDLSAYGRDWTRVHDPAPSAIAFPRSTREVAALMAICDRRRIPVVPSGGRTGLAGGAVAKDRELVLSLARMSRIGEVDPAH